MFLEEGNVFNNFVRPQENTQCVLVRNTKCKHNLFVYKKTPQGTFRKHRSTNLN